MLKKYFLFILVVVLVVGLFWCRKIYKENYMKQPYKVDENELVNLVIYGLGWEETYEINIYNNSDFNLNTGKRKFDIEDHLTDMIKGIKKDSSEPNRIVFEKIEKNYTFKLEENDFETVKKLISEIDKQGLSVYDNFAFSPPRVLINTKETHYDGWLGVSAYEVINTFIKKLLELSTVNLDDVIVARY